MKKVILSLICVIALTLTSHAETKFGIVMEQDFGGGLLVTGKHYSAQVTYSGMNLEINDTTAEAGGIVAQISLKKPVDDTTSFGIGVRYLSFTGDLSDVNEDLSQYGLFAIIEKELAPNLMVKVSMDILSIVEYGDDLSTTHIFPADITIPSFDSSEGIRNLTLVEGNLFRFGVAYLL